MMSMINCKLSQIDIGGVIALLKIIQVFFKTDIFFIGVLVV